jgi:hypothetical protein
MKYIKTDINQAKLEGNSLLPESIRIACYEKFKTIKDFDIPDICGQMEHTSGFTSLQTTPLLLTVNE